MLFKIPKFGIVTVILSPECRDSLTHMTKLIAVSVLGFFELNKRLRSTSESFLDDTCVSGTQARQRKGS